MLHADSMGCTYEPLHFTLSTGYAGVQIPARETHDLSCQGTRCSPPLASLRHEATSLPVAPELTFPKIL